MTGWKKEVGFCWMMDEEKRKGGRCTMGFLLIWEIRRRGFETHIHPLSIRLGLRLSHLVPSLFFSLFAPLLHSQHANVKLP